MVPAARLCAPLSLLVLFASTTRAATYRWNGSAGSDWTTPGSWSTGTGLTAGPAPTGGTFDHRLEVYNNAGGTLEYSAAQGTTTYAVTTGFGRGLLVGSGAGFAGALRITGGVFSTQGSSNSDILGNAVAGTLTLAGGEYRSPSLTFGNGSGGSGTFTVQSGTGTVAAVAFNYGAGGAGTVNLDGGLLSVGAVTRTLTTGSQTFRLNGGRFRATSAAAVLSGLTSVQVRNGGAVIDSNAFNLTFTNPLLHSADIADNAVDGGLVKLGAGSLTLAGANTFTGPVDVQGGGLTLALPSAAAGLFTAAGTALQLNTSGAAVWNAPLAKLDGGAITFDYGPFGGNTTGVVNVTNLELQADVTVNLLGAGIPAGDLVILTYGTRSGPGSFQPGSLPAGAAGTLVDTGTALLWRLDTGSVNSLTWSTGDGVWQTGGGTNWNAGTAVYREYAGGYGDEVTFASGASGLVTVGGVVRPFRLAVDTATAYTFTGAGEIAGAGGLAKSGAGIATFAVPLNLTGPVLANAGAVVVAATGAATGLVTVANGAAFALSGGITNAPGQRAVVQGPGVVGAGVYFPGSAVQRGAITSVSGDNTFAGDIGFSGVNVRFGVQDGARLTLSGALTELAPGTTPSFRAGNAGGSDVVVSGAGNHWTGSTDVFSGGGAVKLGRPDALPTGALLRVGTGGIPGFSFLDLNGHDQTVAGLSQVALDEGAFIENNGPVPAVLTLNPASTQNYLHSIRDGLSRVSLVKTGVATQTLSGACAYTGDTTVAAGELALTSPFLASIADVHLGANARLRLNFTGGNAVDELFINGQPMLAGTWGGVGSGAEHVDPARFAGTGTLVVANGPAPTAYQLWAQAHGLTGAPGLERAESADPDGDGRSNVTEFAVASDPRSPLPSGTVVPSQGTVAGLPHFLLTLPVRAGGNFSGSPGLTSGAVDGVVYTLEGGDDLATWPRVIEEVTGGDAAAAQADLPPLDSAWSYRTFRVLPGGPAPQVRAYIRWQISGGP